MLWVGFRDLPSTRRLIMVSKIITILIALYVSSLVAHDNFNQVSANVDSVGLDSTHLKLNHQSYFYIPSGDALIFELNHGLHKNHMTNTIGIGYRTFLLNTGIGANLYYLNSNEPRAHLHQLSPGLELLYKGVQISYNLYIPTSAKMVVKRGSIYQSRVSEIGVRWSPNKEFTIGMLPFYDHLNARWGLNTRFTYTLKKKYEFGLSPYLNHNGNGCAFSFGINFGTAKEMKPVHRANKFNYLLEPRAVKISIGVTKPAFLPPLNPSGYILPAPFVLPETKEKNHWWDKFKFLNYGSQEAVAPEKSVDDSALGALWHECSDELYLVPPLQQILGAPAGAPCVG
jgi:hypothetical protein